MSPSPKFANEIDRLMRDPDSMRAEAEQMRRSGAGGHYDPNQPRVPAGDPKAASLRRKDIAAEIQAVTPESHRRRLMGRSSLSLARERPMRSPSRLTMSWAS